ncbi:hypothetical protein Dimus_027221 [Dionaea muscipula]
MSCLLPQFKCHPDSSPIHSKLLPPSSSSANILSKGRESVSVSVRARCVASAAAQMLMPTVENTGLHMEKMRLHPLDASSNSIPALRPPLPYFDSIVPTSEAKFEAALATESLIRNEEAVIAAAAAEAVALARAAAKYAKDAAAETQGSDRVRTEYQSASLQLEDEKFHYRGVKLLKSEQSGSVRNIFNADASFTEGYSLRYPICGLDVLEPTNEELELLQAQLLKIVAVRSNRQIERKAKRARAAEKASNDNITVKVGSSSRKKRSPVQHVDYSDPLHYLSGITSTSKLLTAKEEIELSKGIQDLLKLEKLQEELEERYGGQPTFAQWAAAAGVEQKTLRKRLNYGVLCRDKMVKSNIRLVISIAKNYLGVGMSLPDLVQEGWKGLLRGVEKFDASKGFRFSTYAHWWIKQAVRRALSDQSRTIHLPFHMVQAAYRVKMAIRQLYRQNGRYPNDEELAEATGLSMKKLQAVLLIPKSPRSLYQKMGMYQNLKPLEIIADPEAESADDLLVKHFKKLDVEKVLSTLTEREEQVIRWRFGLSDGRMRTLQEIGDSIGFSRERVRQIEASAFRKLKNKNRTINLQQYLY